jgi:hypothetical protein
LKGLGYAVMQIRVIIYSFNLMQGCAVLMQGNSLILQGLQGMQGFIKKIYKRVYLLNLREFFALTLHTLQGCAVYRFQWCTYPAQIKVQPCNNNKIGSSWRLNDMGHSHPAVRTDIGFIYPLYFGYHISFFNRYYK